MNEYDFSEVRHVEHQSRVQPTIRQVAIQKVQPTVLSRVRTLTTPNGTCFYTLCKLGQLSKKMNFGGMMDDTFHL